MNKIEKLADDIRKMEAAHNIKLSFEDIERLARFAGFTEDEIAELIVWYF